MHRPTLLTAPASEPVSLEAAKAHLRVDSDDDDTLIGGFILAAVGHLDGYTGLLGRCIITQVWVQKFDDWRAIMRLPFADVQGVVLNYFDENDVEQTVSSTLYTLFQDGLGNYIRFKDDFTDPSVGPDYGGISATMTCGFGAAGDVPRPLMEAMLLHIGTLYKYRETLGERVAPNMAFESLISPYRRVGIR
jgi:uncharacterized phiE125 gp8 family phage protein